MAKKKNSPPKTVKAAPVKTAPKDAVVELLAIISKQLENFGNIANQTNWLINEHHRLVASHNTLVQEVSKWTGTPAKAPVAEVVAKPTVTVPQAVNGSTADSQKTADLGF